MSRDFLIYFLFFSLAVFALFGFQNVLELRAEEPRRALVGLETYLSGNYIVPQIFGETYYNKPPLFNWIIAGCYSLFGSFDEWVVRFPSTLSILLTALVLFFFSRKYTDTKTSLLATMFYLTCSDLLFYGSVNAGEIDPFYSLIVFLQAVIIFHFSQKKKYLPLYLFSYLLTLIGFLTKGLPSVVFQAITLLATFIYFRQFRALFSKFHLMGIAVFILPLTGYFIAFSLQDNLYGYIINLFKESSQRSANEFPLLQIFKSIGNFPLQFIQITLPWSFILLLLFVKKKGKNSWINFSVLFLFSNISLYWISPEMKNRYLYMFFPFFSLWMAYLWEQKKESKTVMSKILPLVFQIPILALSVVGFLLLLILLNLFPISVFDASSQWAIDFLKTIPHVWIYALSLFALGVLLFFTSIKWKPQLILLSALSFILLRLSYNYIGLPITQADKTVCFYRDTAKEIVEITKNKPVYVTGKPFTFDRDLSLLGVQFEKTTLTVAPQMAWQMGYYITRSTKTIMRYKHHLQPHQFAIETVNSLDSNKVTILYTYTDKWINQKMALYKIKP